jgi:hypothetical protein
MSDLRKSIRLNQRTERGLSQPQHCCLQSDLRIRSGPLASHPLRLGTAALP